MDGLSLTLGGSLGAAIVGAIVKLYAAKTHADATKIPQPCDVHQINDCITVKECNRRMKDLEERMNAMDERISKGFDGLLDKLDAMDQRSEDRAIALNRRIDPMIEKLSETKGRVDAFESRLREAAAATMGGRK